MLQEQKSKEVLKKSYEISYALFRIGGHVYSPAFKDSLERQGLALLEAAAIGDYSRVTAQSIAVEYLIQFGNDTGFIHKVNAESLVVELNALRVFAAHPAESKSNAAISLDDIFSGRTSPRAESASAKETIRQERQEIQPMDMDDNGEEIESTTSGNAAMRQSAILEKIRQSGNCRLKDIQEILPELSERTLRYDLQSLLEQNLIERVGNGGPSVFYRARHIAG